jgi:hypothetical protein
VTGFPALCLARFIGAGVWAEIKGCSNGAYVAATANCPTGTTTTGGPLLLYLQGAGLNGPATDAAGASNINNEEFAILYAGQVPMASGFHLAIRACVGKRSFSPTQVVPPSQTAYGRFLSDPRFPSNGTLPDEWKMIQPRVGFAWDLRNNSKSVLRASWGIYNARQNMLTQVGSITTNGVQQQTIFLNSDIIASGVPGPVWPGVVAPTPVAPGQFPLFTGVRVFSRDYRNPRIYTTNVQFEQQIAPDTALYLDFTHSKGVYLTRFLNANQNGIFQPATRRSRRDQRARQIALSRLHGRRAQAVLAWLPTRRQLRVVERPG